MNSTSPLSFVLDRAPAILTNTDLISFFASRFGTAELTGSARYELMVSRDIDMHMPVAAGQRLEWAALLPDLAERLERSELRLHKAQFLAWSPDGDRPVLPRSIALPLKDQVRGAIRGAGLASSVRPDDAADLAAQVGRAFEPHRINRPIQPDCHL